MVCTVETGTREIASEPKMCPPTWNAAMGSVCMRICLVGWRRRAVQLSVRLLPSQHSPATKKNCTIVRVTGKRKLLRMTLPVLLDTAEVAYHSVQRSTKRSVPAAGRVDAMFSDTELRRRWAWAVGGGESKL